MRWHRVLLESNRLAVGTMREKCVEKPEPGLIIILTANFFHILSVLFA